MQFVKLRLSGFKSFVDQTELLIEPGLTGIVGPNGCGKSNLVEALRWVMGETSARRMRGAEMDDVIFGGTASRSARNLAEVVLTLDNRARREVALPEGIATLPGADADTLEVVRRISRGEGSDYRLNGKSARARDIQILFQDNASGANSPSLVSQGRIGALITAKPEDRRGLLEEAAGVAGLHARRHEAELRLRAAEANLGRLDDVIAGMDARLGTLRKQARQAARYRTLGDQIRRTEAVLLHLQRQALEREEEAARAAFAEADRAVQALMIAVTDLDRHRTQEAEAVPALRRAEAEAAQALQRLVVEREQIDREERRLTEADAACRRRLAQVSADLERETHLAADAEAALARLAEEREALTGEQDGEAGEAEAAEAALDAAGTIVETADAALAELTERTAAAEARRAALGREITDAGNRAEAAGRRRDEQMRQIAALDREIETLPDPSEAEAAVAGAEAAQAQAEEAAETAERQRAEADHAAGEAAELARTAAAARTRLAAEADALADLLRADTGDLFAPLIDGLTVADGYEAAVAASLGDDLTAPLDEAAPVHWQTLPPLPAPPGLPAGAEPLAARVQGPPALARRLSQTGIVPDAETGARLAPALGPGQRLVTTEGGAWRWDGLTIRAGAPTAAAIRLKQRNRLHVLRGELEEAEQAAADARARQQAAEARAAEAAARLRDTRGAVQAAFRVRAEANDRLAAQRRASSAAETRRATLAEAMERLDAECAEAMERLALAEAQAAELPDPGESRDAVAEARARLAEARAMQSERRAALDRLTRAAEARRRRLDAIEAEIRPWRERAGGAGDRLRDLEQRAASIRTELEELAERPFALADARAGLGGAIAEAERARARAVEALTAAETALATREQALRATEARLADARETRVRAEAAVGTALKAAETLAARIVERLNVAPDAVAALAGADEAPAPAELEARLGRLLRERDGMGPVNLLAEQETAEAEAEIARLNEERSDLTQAIARLRHGIAGLNREARERLVAAFETVDARFQDLFVRLFGGGRAHLKLTEAEDPLDAGLEIFASPPGKKLQVLSLLSGGEQALTALALIFAVFVANPAPICVLDEVDAPLDEANVDRFCALADEMARSLDTRFLVITHHRLTMARMDRLYGVTMAERGVSQLVSVDLGGVERLRAAE